ncbi:hypothetical protein KAFR_0G01310 [Kazachstania africana CBS 2517]|uniref:Vps72/YL1 C-terminal domain-containing protein n=1 Tax=Kazachstania africana (strain ATCC 22294 / BCRC 22015 / CBS 2517 / CECT 1963 / NBRC 1671 / NRRL Y-8276) TaxID=1071382 RepID=H2AXR5_KAZAF|nr:hypothetical protein KAFR_0G01310 [Kazachstania africana CBS 2517]CCF59165.1 hypothetical protein KAFR_0G01310 [Kazachstania africana CBS 2517]
MEELPSDFSDSSDESVELLMTTRERRSNAGNKLKKLLEEELEHENNVKGQYQDNEDELDLLFQEDEDDQDFDFESTTVKKIKTVGEYDDLLFSESEDEPESNSASDEEAELRRQERLQKRKAQKKKSMPAIKRTVTANDSVQAAKKRKMISEEINAESLLKATRRTSKRTSVVENKLKVYERLSKAEEKRKLIKEKLEKQRQLKAEHFKSLTQEDRLNIAKETEKTNLLSLNKYREQEVYQKQRRLALQNQAKLNRFRPNELILEYLSTTWTVTPFMELEDSKYWTSELLRRDKIYNKRLYRRKYSRKNKMKKLEEQKNESMQNENVRSNPVDGPSGDKKLDFPEKRALTSNDVLRESSVEPNHKNGGELGNNSEPYKSEAAFNEHHPDSKQPLDRQPINEGNSLSHEASVDSNGSTEISMQDSNSISHGLTLHNRQAFEATSVDEYQTEGSREAFTVLPEKESDNGGESSAAGPTLEALDSQTKTAEDTYSSVPLKHEDIDEKGHVGSVIADGKQVKFDIEPQVNLIDDTISPAIENEVEETKDTNKSEDILVFEGPLQQVGKNFVTAFFYSSMINPDTKYDKKPTYNILGEKKPVVEQLKFEPMLRSRLEIEEGTESASQLQLPSLDILNSFPKFGEFDRKVKEDVKVEENKDNTFKIITPAPTGIYVASTNNTSTNVKKKCLINNDDCHYFDPKLGIPYSNLNSYKVIQRIHQCQEEGEENYKWFGFKNGGLFLNTTQKPAKGVPENFY